MERCYKHFRRLLLREFDQNVDWFSGKNCSSALWSFTRVAAGQSGDAQMRAAADCAADGMASHAAGCDHTSMPGDPQAAALCAGRARGAACRARAGWGVLAGGHLLLPLPGTGHGARAQAGMADQPGSACTVTWQNSRAQVWIKCHQVPEVRGRLCRGAAFRHGQAGPVFSWQ